MYLVIFHICTCIDINTVCTYRIIYSGFDRDNYSSSNGVSSLLVREKKLYVERERLFFFFFKKANDDELFNDTTYMYASAVRLVKMYSSSRESAACVL